jgi:3-oxoacyl-[acyl-carrier-protein] synthase II
MEAEHDNDSSDIAITGIGVISAIGNDRRTFFDNCRQAKSGIALTEPKGGDQRAGIACRVTGFDPRNYFPQRQFRRMSQASRMAVAASIDALADSGLAGGMPEPDRTGVVVGTSDGPSSQVETFFLSLLESGPRGTQPFYFPETVPNAPASHMAMFHGLTGPNTTFCQNMISAEAAIRYAADLLVARQADVLFCGGTDEISAMQYECYRAVGALNRAVADERGRPVPVPGSGLVLGEGAGCLIMERLADARARGGRIYGILRACILSGTPAATGHYGSVRQTLGRAIDDCLRAAGADAAAVRQFNVSANFSQEQDAEEIAALASRFSGSGEFRISPLKTLLGEFGGVGILRAAASLMSLHEQSALATLAPEAMTTSSFSPAWQTAASPPGTAALMTSATYGGGCCAMLFGKAGDGTP